MDEQETLGKTARDEIELSGDDTEDFQDVWSLQTWRERKQEMESCKEDSINEDLVVSGALDSTWGKRRK